MSLVASLLACAALGGTGACLCEPTKPKADAGPDGGTASEGEGEGAGEGEGNTGPDGGPKCTPQTEGFGQPCATQGEDPPCGTFICNPIADQLVCNDPGDNACGFCGQLDQHVARVGQPCGVDLCGVGACPLSVDGGPVVCQGGDVLRNECGGCTPLPAGLHPGDVCSACQTGTQTCTADENNLACFHGRSPDNQCGGCGRCVLFHAFMEDHVAGGGFLEPGTVAIIEDIGGGQPLQLLFDPLIAGPGASGLPNAQVFLSDTVDALQGFSETLTDAQGEGFTTNIPGQLVPMDPVRAFVVPQFGGDPSQFTYVVLEDMSGLFQDPVISVGILEAGPPPDTSPTDAGTATDAGSAATDAGSAATDAGSAATDAGPSDAGVVDAG